MNIQSITEDQYYLASKVHIPLSESNELADFERESLINLLVKDLKSQAETEKMKKPM